MTLSTTSTSPRPKATGFPRVVVVTGATAGVGRATTRLLASRGADVAILARGAEGLRATSEEARRAGVRALPLQVDVADPGAIEVAAERIEAELGPIDVWINNAMATVFSRFVKITPEEFRRVTEVTYLGTVYGTMAALRRMQARDRGTIVQVGSALSYRAIPLQSAYCGAKHAIRGFTNSLRTELMHDGSGVHVTMVQLSGINTPQFDWCRSKMPRRAKPIGAVYQPELAARAIVWAATHRRREVSVGWPAVEAIYGNKVLPRYADRELARIGFDGQQSDEEEPERPNNLFEPVAGDFGAHGRFDDRALAMSPQLLANLHRGRTLGLGALGLAAGAILYAWSR